MYNDERDVSAHTTFALRTRTVMVIFYPPANQPTVSRKTKQKNETITTTILMSRGARAEVTALKCNKNAIKKSPVLAIVLQWALKKMYVTNHAVLKRKSAGWTEMSEHKIIFKTFWVTLKSIRKITLKNTSESRIKWCANFRKFYTEKFPQGNFQKY